MSTNTLITFSVNLRDEMKAQDVNAASLERKIKSIGGNVEVSTIRNYMKFDGDAKITDAYLGKLEVISKALGRTVIEMLTPKDEDMLALKVNRSKLSRGIAEAAKLMNGSNKMSVEACWEIAENLDGFTNFVALHYEQIEKHTPIVRKVG